MGRISVDSGSPVNGTFSSVAGHLSRDTLNFASEDALEWIYSSRDKSQVSTSRKTILNSGQFGTRELTCSDAKALTTILPFRQLCISTRLKRMNSVFIAYSSISWKCAVFKVRRNPIGCATGILGRVVRQMSGAIDSEEAGTQKNAAHATCVPDWCRGGRQYCQQKGLGSLCQYSRRLW